MESEVKKEACLTKKCCKCKEFLALDRFQKNRSRYDGLEHYCRPCKTKRTQEWRLRNPEKAESLKIKHRERRRLNPEPYKTSSKKWRKDNPDKVKGLLLRSFWPNLTSLERAQKYKQLLIDQNNVCAICKQPESVINEHGKVKDLAVDHCHATGEVRGLLCSKCNSVLGYAKDNIETLSNAINYLEKSQKEVV